VRLVATITAGIQTGATAARRTATPGSEPIARIGILWRGSPTDDPPPRETNRLRRIFEEIEARGAAAEPIVFAEEVAEDVRGRLSSLDGVLVWVDPIVRGRDRSVLDAILRDAAGQGLYVSAHPDVIRKMGSKDVLVRTRDMEWGGDTHLFRSLADLREALPSLLRTGPRVLKQYHGSQGDGVWKVALLSEASGAGDAMVRVLHAQRGSRLEDLPLGEFLQRCEVYFARSSCVIDQPYQDRLAEGMIRCYLVHDGVVGFGHQFVTALLPPPEGTVESPPPPPRYYFGPTKPEFQDLKRELESGWVSEMQRLCGIDAADLPAIWDADFLLGAKTSSGEDTYVLGEINVSGVFPIPDEAVAPLAEAAIARALAARANRRDPSR